MCRLVRLVTLELKRARLCVPSKISSPLFVSHASSLSSLCSPRSALCAPQPVAPCRGGGRDRARPAPPPRPPTPRTAPGSLQVRKKEEAPTVNTRQGQAWKPPSTWKPPRSRAPALEARYVITASGEPLSCASNSRTAWEKLRPTGKQSPDTSTTAGRPRGCMRRRISRAAIGERSGLSRSPSPVSSLPVLQFTKTSSRVP